MISIIVPVYNTITYLHQCIDSLLNQTYTDLEILLVDDGSNDGSEILCDKYTDKDCRIRVIHKENGGIVSARKVGLKAATGEFIGFVDSDDWIEADMFEKLYSVLMTENVDVAMCGRYEDSDKRRKSVYHGLLEGKYEGKKLREEVFPKMIMNGVFFEWGVFPGYWDKLFRKHIIWEALMAVDDRIVMGEDAVCVYPCILKAKSIFVIHKCLYHYRQSSQSMVRKLSEETERERKRFQILFSSGLYQFKQNKEIYDFREQWLKYMLFLMTPRADILYSDLDKLDYLFPFPKVKKGSRIIIYSAGLWGKRLYHYLNKTQFCDVVAVMDRNYKMLNSEEMKVISPAYISSISHDAIVIAASYASARKEIMEELREKYPNDNIWGLDEGEVFSSKTLKAFGLLELEKPE